MLSTLSPVSRFIRYAILFLLSAGTGVVMVNPGVDAWEVEHAAESARAMTAAVEMEDFIM